MQPIPRDADALRRDAAEKDLVFFQQRLGLLLGALDDIFAGRVALMTEPTRSVLEHAFARARAVGIGFSAEIDRLREEVRGARTLPVNAESIGSRPSAAVETSETLTLTERAP